MTPSGIHLDDRHEVQTAIAIPTKRTPLSLVLLDLPNEVLTTIFKYLDTQPPSSTKSCSKPEADLTFSQEQTLKNISFTNTKLRRLVLPQLFRHARLDPYCLSPFLEFLDRSDLSRYVVSVTAHLQGPCNHIHPAWWSTLQDRLPNLDTITTLAAPNIFSEIAQISVDTSQSWAFKIPLQTLTLQGGGRGRQTVPRTLYQDDDDNDKAPGTTIDSRPSPQSLLSARNWTSLLINESSHLPAYSTYEFFLKVPPSLMASIQRYLRPYSHSQFSPQSRHLNPSSSSLSITSFFNNLKSFSYIAIFPFYNHVDEILKCVRQMKNLTRLFIKLCHNPESNVLQDEIEHNNSNAGRTEGRIDVNDPWNEFETSYLLIPHTIKFLTQEGSLQEFQSDDFKMVGIQRTIVTSIDTSLAETGCWSHAGDGVWKRDMGKDRDVSGLVG